MIYLDSNATTQVHPEVLEAMMPFLTTHWHNPSSGYRASKVVKKALDDARAQVAELIRASPEEIVFTGCGTESNNSILAFLASQAGERQTIITSTIEHSAILRYSDHLVETRGFHLKKVPVTSEGRLSLPDYKKELSSGDAAMASIMWANNETGVIQPIAEASEYARSVGVPFHTDAIQAVGKTPVNVQDVAVDFLSISGHKLHAPKGVGAMYIRKGVRFDPMLIGGGQESGRRSGTENVASIVGLGKAAELMKARLDKDALSGVAQLRDHLESRLLAELEGVQVGIERGLDLLVADPFAGGQAGTPAHLRPRLEHRDLPAVLLQFVGRAQACQARADDDRRRLFILAQRHRAEHPQHEKRRGAQPP